jgi:FkbM family methyltransferase
MKITIGKLINSILGLVGIRLVKSEALKPTPVHIEPSSFALEIGEYSILTNSSTMLRAYKISPENNQVISRLVNFLAKDADFSMIDVGANCGDTCAMAKKDCPDLEVLCIEGDDTLFEVLKQNDAQFTNTELMKCYLGEKPERIRVSIDQFGKNNTLSVKDINGGQSAEIEIKTLDEVVEGWTGLSKLRFIKCDTEGFDIRVLLGAEKLIMGKKPVLLFEYNRQAMDLVGEEGTRIFKRLSDWGYKRIGVYDAYSRFLLSMKLDEKELLQDLEEYIDGKPISVFFYDFVVFSEEDDNLARDFFGAERSYRKEIPRK